MKLSDTPSQPRRLDTQYREERDWMTTPALHRQVSRETSYASLRTPASVAFPGHIGVHTSSGMVPPPSPGYYHRHKSSTFSTSGLGASNNWSSRQGWTPGSGSIRTQNQDQGQGQASFADLYGQGDFEDDMDGFHPFESRFPDTDPSTVTF